MKIPADAKSVMLRGQDPYVAWEYLANTARMEVFHVNSVAAYTAIGLRDNFAIHVGFQR